MCQKSKMVAWKYIICSQFLLPNQLKINGGNLNGVGISEIDPVKPKSRLVVVSLFVRELVCVY